MLEKLRQIWQAKDLRNSILFILLMLIIFRIAAHIPIPAINVANLRQFFAQNQIFGLLNIFSGGGLESFSIVMLGVGPYITSSIIFQLLTMIVPSLEAMSKDTQGQHKINQYTRVLTIPLAALQGYGYITLLQRQSGDLLGALTSFQWTSALLTIIVGTVFLMWIGELISEKKIGNGISLLIFAGIIAGVPTQMRQFFLNFDPSMVPTAVVFLIVFVIVIAGVVFINDSQRNIPISYAKRVRGSKVYGGTSTYLPLKVNQAGVIPIIFAMSILLFPQMLGNFMQLAPQEWLKDLGTSLAGFFTAGGFMYGLFYFILVILFTYFYTAVTFDTKQIAEGVQKHGGFVPGIRPGNPTAE